MNARDDGGRSPGRAFPDQAVENLLPLWIFGVAWLVASAFIVPPLVSSALKKPEHVGLLALAFPAVGVVLVLWALRRSLRVWKFGESTLRVDAFPITPGGDLVGTIQVNRPFRGRQAMRLRLRCIRQRHYTTNKRTTSETVLWEQLQNVEMVPGSSKGAEVAVRFHIPPSAQPSTGFDWTRIIWRLEARGKPGLVNFFARFEVPAGPATIEVAKPDVAPPAPVPRRAGPDSRAQMQEASIVCRPLDDGGLHFHLAAGRCKPMGPMVAGLAFTGIAVGLFLLPVPGVEWIAPIAFGAFILFLGAVFDYITIYNLLVSQNLTVHRGSLVMERRALFFHWGRTFDVSDVGGITCRQDGATGDSIFHGIELKDRQGKSTWLANNISQRDYAEWMTDEINATLGRVSEG
jgi:hypothetical protein